MLCHDNRTNHNNRYFRIGLLHMLPPYTVTWVNLLGNSMHGNKISNIQKKIIRIMGSTKSRVSRKILFCKLKYFHLQVNTYSTHYHLGWKSWKNFKEILYVHNLNLRHKYDHHMPNAKLTKYQGEVHHSDIKLFNNLLPTIRSLNHNIRVIKPALKICL
jgi:hypothetical protein